MDRIDLVSHRVVLDAPRSDDIADITRYCQDPVFEHTLTLPWPYGRSDADHFVNEFVPRGWSIGDEFTWALRIEPGGPLLGVIGLRAPTSDIGYWLGAEHRGHGHMTEAVRLVADWAFDSAGAGLAEIGWECVTGNTSSAAVARRSGFRFAGEGPSRIPFRHGRHPPSWHGTLRAGDDRSPRKGWPAW